MMNGFYKKKGEEDLTSGVVALKDVTLESHNLDLVVYVSIDDCFDQNATNLKVMTSSDFNTGYESATEEEVMTFVKSYGNQCCNGTDPNCEGCGEGCTCSK